jgi:hypothetical protein
LVTTFIKSGCQSVVKAGESPVEQESFFFVSEENEIYLVHIFDKSEYENIPKDKLIEMLKSAGLIL